MKIQEFVGKLNTYSGDNIWQDVILHDAYDIDQHPFNEDKSVNGSGQVIYFESGLQVIWDEPTKGWEVNPNTCDHEMKLMTDDDGKCYPYNTSWSYWECEICGATKEPGPHDHYDPDF